MVDGVGYALGVVGFQFGGGDGDAVEEQCEVDAVFVVRGVAQLAHHAQAIGGVAGLEVGVHGQGGAELAERDGLLDADHVEPGAEQMQRALFVEGGAQPVGQGGGGAGAVGGGEAGPGGGLGLLDPGGEVVGEQGARPVVAGGGVGFVEPSGAGKMGADAFLQGNFPVQAHAADLCWIPRAH